MKAERIIVISYVDIFLLSKYKYMSHQILWKQSFDNFSNLGLFNLLNILSEVKKFYEFNHGVCECFSILPTNEILFSKYSFTLEINLLL